jgi:ABC-type branched-subunit amino acid transport system ATPase component/ABC-type branched-subunit amino acid transport system permease subunit
MSRIFISLILSLPLIGAYGIFAIGIVMIYRASRMLNLAHGAMAMVPAFAMYSFVKAGLPVFAALPLAILLGAALGLAVEKVFVSRLRRDGPTAQTVGTVAALGIMVAIAARIYGTASLNAPPVFPTKRIPIGLSSIQVGEVGLFLVMLAVSAVLFVMIQKTDLGLKMRGVAESRLAASLMGVDPSYITSLTWAIGGALAALAGILLAAVTSLHPYTLALQVLPAFIAALLGGLGSLPGALIGAGIVGATQGLVPILGPIGKLQGAPQLFLAALAIVVMATRGRKLATSDDAPAAAPAGASKAPSPSHLSKTNQPNPRRTFAIMAGIGGMIAFAFIPQIPSSFVATANLAISYAVIAASLVLLTGWVGQISLGHAALVGIGAYATGHIVAALHIPFPLSLPLAALASGIAAALLGAVALRVRGLYLAVATLVFSWMASEFLFRQHWFIAHAQIPATPIGTKGSLSFFDFTDRRTFFLVAAATLAAVVFAAANIRDSKTGRAFFAIRGSEMAAASLGIDVTRYKLLAFIVSGAIAGVAGNLIMTDARVVTSDQFTFNISLFFVAVAVVGGLTSLSGAIASGMVFAGLTELFFRVPSLGAFLEIVSSLLLAVVLLAYPGGLASLPSRARDYRARIAALISKLIPARAKKAPASQEGMPRTRPATTASATRRAVLMRRTQRKVSTFSLKAAIINLLPARKPRSVKAPASLRVQPSVSASTAGPLDFTQALEAVQKAPNGDHSPETPEEDLKTKKARIAALIPTTDRYVRPTLIEASHVTVKFGGLTAVNDASLEVHEGEIVGLIGPNGAGKTTLFNSIAGYNNPTQGAIKLYGDDVTDLPVHQRAVKGVARTFQLIQLFRQLTVYQNLLVATHVHNPTGFMSHLAVTRSCIDQENRAAQRAKEIIELLDLKDIAHRPTSDLPFGTLRMIEVARALVTGFRVIMLDEPASGLDHNETDKLMEVLRFVRGLGVTLLLIEHDVRMVTGVSDYIYVLDQGQIISQGTSHEIQQDPKVIAAYLGEPETEKAGV